MSFCEVLHESQTSFFYFLEIIYIKKLRKKKYTKTFLFLLNLVNLEKYELSIPNTGKYINLRTQLEL